MGSACSSASSATVMEASVVTGAPSKITCNNNREQVTTTKAVGAATKDTTTITIATKQQRHSPLTTKQHDPNSICSTFHGQQQQTDDEYFVHLESDEEQSSSFTDMTATTTTEDGAALSGSDTATGAFQKAKIQHDCNMVERNFGEGGSGSVDRDNSKTITGTITFQYHKGTCALEYYEPIKSLGEGSISSIHLVKRRQRRVSIPYRERSDIMLHSSSNGGTTSATSSSTAQQTVTHDKQSKEQQHQQQVYVLKSIMKDHITNDECIEEMRREIYTMKYLDHPNIVKVFEAFERHRHVYMIMEYCSGGDLHQRFPYSENEARDVIRQILSAVTYLHSKKVVHRDLKLENVVFESSSRDNNTIKLIDFGLATKYLSNEFRHMNETVGTVYTMAPQVLQGGPYTSACDLWSIGVICYTLLSGGSLPFPGVTRNEIVQHIQQCDYTFDGPTWSNISQDAKDFISSLLQVDPKQRPTASAALKSSKWMMKKKKQGTCCPSAFPFNKAGELSCTNESSPSQTCSSEELFIPTCENLNRYSQEAKLKRLALMYIAYHSPPQDVVNLRQVFQEYDQNGDGDGSISFWEFHHCLTKQQKAGLTKDEIRTIFDQLDMKQDGYIDYTEFLAATLETKVQIEIDRLQDVFDRFDIDKTGTISRQNLIQALGDEWSATPHHNHSNLSLSSNKKMLTTEEFVDDMMKELNLERNDNITFEDFSKLFEEKQRRQSECFRTCCTTSSSKPEVKNREDSKIISREVVVGPGDFN